MTAARFGPLYTAQLPVSLAVDIQRAREELETTETPWEPFRELAGVIARAASTDAKLYLAIPWKLVPAFITSAYRARDTCNPSKAAGLATVAWRAAYALEHRPAIDRLGDIA